MSTILSVQNLSIQYKNQSCCSVNSLSFDLKKGETLCLHGNSGCGKSTVVWTIMGRIRSMGGIASGLALKSNGEKFVGKSLPWCRNLL